MKKRLLFILSLVVLVAATAALLFAVNVSAATAYKEYGEDQVTGGRLSGESWCFEPATYLTETIAPVDFTNVTLLHNCAFGNDLSLLYAIPQSELVGCADIRLVVEKQQYIGNTPTDPIRRTLYPTEYIIDGVPYYRFDYTEVHAKEMGDLLEATLCFTFDGVEYSGIIDTYSLRWYAESRLVESHDDAFLALMVDLLHYGAAAQEYFGYRTDSLVNEGLYEWQKRYTRGHYDTLADLSQDGDTGSYTAAITRKNVRFANRIALLFATNLAQDSDLGGITLRIRYTDRLGQPVEQTVDGADFVYRTDVGGYTACYDGLKASELRTTLELTLLQNGTPISATVQYNLDTYVKNRLENSADENFRSLLEKALIYSDSAKDYFSTTQ